MATRKKKAVKVQGKLNVSKEVKALAREQVGRVKTTRPIEPKQTRKRPKYPERFEGNGDDA